jgi:hypothetical protein
MFQFPGYNLHYLFDSVMDAVTLLTAGCPIRVPPDLGLFAAPRGLSQLTAPFVASWHLGIHRKPLLT